MQLVTYANIGNFNRTIKIDCTHGFPDTFWFWPSDAALEQTIEVLKARCSAIVLRPQDLSVGSDFVLRNGLRISSFVCQKLFYLVSGPGISIRTKILRNPRVNYKLFNKIMEEYGASLHNMHYVYDMELGLVIDVFPGFVPKIWPLERILQYLKAIQLKGLAEILWAGWSLDEFYTCVYAEDCSWLGIAWPAPPKYAMRRYMGKAVVEDVDQLEGVKFMAGPLFPVFEGARLLLDNYPAKFELVLTRLIRVRRKHKEKRIKFRFGQ